VIVDAAVIQTLMYGLTIGVVYVLMALGFTLIFGILRIVNFAHGEFYMIGAFVVRELFARAGLDYFVSVVVAAVAVGLFGVVVERGLFRPFRDKVEHQVLIVSFALSVALQQMGVILWGAEDVSIEAPFSGVVRWGGVVFPQDRLVAVAACLVILAGFYVLLKRTRIGLAMEAVVQDPEAALIQGIRVDRVYAFTFGIGTLLAAAAGGLIGPVFSLTPYMGTLPLVKAFIAVILGGMGSVTGAVVGGLVIGISETFLSTYFGGAAAAILQFAVIMLILVLRPSGLFGRA
jgi:branched-chain amino acid transport system permease protein